MIEFLLKKRRVILFIVLPALALGIFSINVLPVKLYPNMRKPRINVHIPHSGLTAEDFFNDYSDIIEERLNSIQDIDLIESEYENNSSRIRVEFDWKVDSEEAKARVLSEMNSIKSNLPEESEDFSVNYWRGQSGFLSIAVTSESIDSYELYQILESSLKPKFTSVKDAEEVDIFDVDDITAEIRLKPEAILNYGLTIDTVANVIRNGYKNISVGYFDNNIEHINVRIKRDIDNIFNIEKIIVDTIGNKIIYLKDIANVNIKHALPRRVYRANGKRSVLIFATPKEDGNIKKMSEEIAKIIKETKNELPADIDFNFIIDPAKFINNAITNVVRSGLTGAFLAILVVLIMLGEVKNTIIISISLPTSIILSFILMNIFKVSLNLISLGGIALAVGMIIDASIVVIENIHRHRLEAVEKHKKLNFIHVIIASVNEVRNAVIASTLTTVCVFFPISYTSPLTNAILGDIARSVIFTLMCSLFVALIVIPVIAFYLFRKDHNAGKNGYKINKLQQTSINITEKFKNGYIAVLKKLLYSKKLSLIFIISSFTFLLLLIIFVLPMIKKEIIAQPISSSIAISFTHFGSVDKEEMMNNIEPVEKEIVAKYKNKIINIFTTLFRENSGNIVVTFKNSFGINKILDEMKMKYTSNPEWRFDVFPWDPSSLPLPRTDDLHIKVYGPDKKQIVALMEEIVDLINKEKIFRNVHSEPTTKTQDEIILVPRFETIAQFNDYPLTKLTSLTGIALNGRKVIEMKQDNKELDIYMMYEEDLINKSEDIENFLIPFNDKAIPLKHFFDIKKQKSIPEIRSDNGEETYNVYGSMMRADSKSKRAFYEEEVKNLLKEKLKVPDGYFVQFQDTQLIINESVKSLLIALIASIVLIYIVLGIQFNSIKIPLIILVTIPLGFIGVIISLFVFNSTVSLNSLLGTILLGGIVVNNAIIIIDFYLKEYKKTINKTELILRVARLRVLPISITTTTTILGMMPIAIAIGDGANILQPLGISVSCGLAISTFFTLFMIPCIMNFVDLTPQHHKDDL
ncbi:MAG: efflux RND transporter permease subunit [Spirochaetes bacterium]|nr:efflux RND transporter permease subunit [Spirochaetota bacterium]